MENDPYIKLSRIRDDYGLEGRQGTTLKLSELEGFTPEQLFQLRTVLADECQDIEYQINLELKRCEKDARWMYGCKNSLKARQVFVTRIGEILGDVSVVNEIGKNFMRAAKAALDGGTYAKIFAVAQGRSEVFSASDLG